LVVKKKFVTMHGNMIVMHTSVYAQHSGSIKPTVMAHHN